jgi:hypothetical protein
MISLLLRSANGQKRADPLVGGAQPFSSFTRESAVRSFLLRFVEQEMNLLLLLSANVQKRANPFMGGV